MNVAEVETLVLGGMTKYRGFTGAEENKEVLGNVAEVKTVCLFYVGGGKANIMKGVYR